MGLKPTAQYPLPPSRNDTTYLATHLARGRGQGEGQGRGGEVRVRARAVGAGSGSGPREGQCQIVGKGEGGMTEVHMAYVTTNHTPRCRLVCNSIPGLPPDEVCAYGPGLGLFRCLGHGF